MATTIVRFSQAKRNFGRVAARAKLGDTVVIRYGADLFRIVYQPPAEIIPRRRAGFFKLEEQDLREINGALFG